MQVSAYHQKTAPIGKVGEYIGFLFLVLTFTINPYLMYICPHYVIGFSHFTAMTHLGRDPVTATIFNTFLVIQGILIFLHFYLYFDRNRPVYQFWYGWKAVKRLQYISALGVAGVGLFPDSDALHAPHVVSAALAFGAATFAIVILSFNYFALRGENQGYFQAMASFGMVIMVLGLSFSSVFVFIGVNQGLWQTAQLVILYIWYTLENVLYKRKRGELEQLDQKAISINGLRNLRIAILILFVFSLSLIITGILGFIDMDILSKCNGDSCKPNITDYQVFFGFGALLFTILGLIYRLTRRFEA